MSDAQSYSQLHFVILQITHIFVDEAHCTLSWGKSNFRPDYLKIASVRAILTSTKCVALTATATSQAEILMELAMGPSTSDNQITRKVLYLNLYSMPIPSEYNFSNSVHYMSLMGQTFQSNLLKKVHLPVKQCIELAKSRGYLGFSMVTPPPQRFPFGCDNVKIF